MIDKDVLAAENPYGMNYKLFYPETLAEELPLLVFLHGAGERGKEISHLYRHGVPKLLCEGMQIPAVVLCPQCPANAVLDNVVYKLKELIFPFWIFSRIIWSVTSKSFSELNFVLL